MEFTYTAYANLIEQLKLRDYAISDYQQAGQAPKEVILRHDVDSDLTKALEFAKFEHSLGVNSTYFILMSSRHYNVLARQSLEMIREIKQLGHDIGLHFDEKNYDMETDADFLSKVAFETETMRCAVGVPIKSVSMHRPSPKTLEKDWNLMEHGGVINSYSKLFFREYKYISDSRMAWREDVEHIVASGMYPKLHILTHPFWYDEMEQTMYDNIKSFCMRANRERYLCMKENITDLQEICSLAEIE